MKARQIDIQIWRAQIESSVLLNISGTEESGLVAFG